jgi:hypothetical protein
MTDIMKLGRELGERLTEGRETAGKRRAEESERLARPATTGDIERLINAVNTGWVGRGFAIGVGTTLLGLLAGFALAILWTSMAGGF